MKKGRILIVDDEQGIRELLVNEFSKLGYQVFSAVDGEDAINQLKSEKTDVIITDMKMPRVDGLDLLKYVKEHSPETEVIFITGYATVENALEAMRSGAYDFVQKPFNIDELVNLVDKAMEKTELKMLVALYESTNAVFSSLKLEELLPVMVSLIKKVTFSHDSVIFLLDNNEHIYLASSSLPRYEGQKKELEKLVSQVYSDSSKKSQPLFFDTANPPEGLINIFGADTDIKSVLVYPVILKDNIMGYLLLTKNSQMSSFVRADLKNVSVFVSQIAQSIFNTKLYEKLEVKVAELEDMKKALQDCKEKTEN